MAGRWSWLGGYVLVIVVALVLAGLLSELDLFRQTTFGKSKLSAAHLLRFLAYAGSLGLVWLAGARAAVQLRSEGGRAAFLGYLVTPLTTLLVVIGAYHALLIVLQPFMGAAARNTYNWLFILGIALAALWLATVLFHHAQAIIELFRSSAGPRGETGQRCPGCGAAVAADARFCPRCGEAFSR